MEVRAALALVVCGCLSFGCLTFVENPGHFRERHPSVLLGGFGTAGGSIGYMRHLGKRWAYQVELARDLRPETFTMRLGSDVASVNQEIEPDSFDRIFFEEQSKVGLGIMYFPWTNGSFFTGAHAQMRWFQTAYNEHTLDFSKSQKTTNIEWLDEQVEVAIPLGFSRNTEQKLTVIGALVPTWKVHGQRRFVDDGRDHGVDVDKMEQALQGIDKERNLSWQFFTGMGYAF